MGRADHHHRALSSDVSTGALPGVAAAARFVAVAVITSAAEDMLAVKTVRAAHLLALSWMAVSVSQPPVLTHTHLVI
jgi:hypothetical protein